MRQSRYDKALEANKILVDRGFDPIVKMLDLYAQLEIEANEADGNEQRLAIIDRQISVANHLLPYRYAKWRGASSEKNQEPPKVATYIQNFSGDVTITPKRNAEFIYDGQEE